MTRYRGVSRRGMLRSLAAGGLAGAGLLTAGRALASGPHSAPSTAPRAAGLPLTVVNQTGAFDNTSIWLYVVGNDGTQQVRVTPEGEAVPVSLSDNGSDGFTDYAIPLSSSGDTTLHLPHMSGRIYTSLGDKLRFKAVEDGNGQAALAYPAGWVDSDPNYPVLHDCAEFTYNPNGMYCNTTMVDMLSVPLSLHLTGAQDQTTGTFREGARDRVFAELAEVEAFGALVDGERRVIAPGHGLDTGLFPADYLAPYIEESWAAYTDGGLRVTTNAGEFTGHTDGDRLVFTGPGDVAFDRPSTRDVLFCDGTLAAPNDGITGPVAAIIGAALNRGTLHSHPAQPTTDAGTFYGTDLTNHYARVMHTATQDGRAYGFAFDDVAGFASYIEDGAPQQITLTLTPF